MSESDDVGIQLKAIQEAENLPSLPTVAIEVLRLSRDDNAEIDDLGRAISSDPALSAKILKVANSAQYCSGSPITSLNGAIELLGMKAVNLMALSFSLVGDLHDSGSDDQFDYAKFWRYSLTTAVAARSLSNLVASPYHDEAFICGLLGRIGQLVMAKCLPDEYSRVIALASSDLPTAELERENLGFDHLQVGAMLLNSWQLPTLICSTLESQESDPHTEEEDDGPESKFKRIFQMAHHTTRLICAEDKGTALQTLYDAGAEHFSLSQADIDSFILQLEVEINDTAALLKFDPPNTEQYERIINEARNQMVQISLGAAFELQKSNSRSKELELERNQLEIQANTDKLTGIPNRGSFDQFLKKEIEAKFNSSESKPIGLLLLDVDHFKKFNDSYGHLLGDEVLKHVAKWIKEVTRGSDFPARYGGEEFAVIMPGSNLASVSAIAERVRDRISQGRVEHNGESLSVTASVGGACLEEVNSSDEAQILLEEADRCLYEAKDSGRDRCICKVLQTNKV